jgi:hypothetical protein
MTITEYTDPARFPLTTQRGLSARNQLLIDAVNFDALRKFLDEGGIPGENQRGRWAELQEKMQHHARRTAELAQAEGTEKPGKGKG